MRFIKDEIRILGFDDAPFKPRSNEKILVIGVIYRGGNFLDGILKTEITGDGMDATESIIKLIKNSRHKDEIRVIIFKGITIGGFNLIDIKKIYNETKIPVIVITRKKPNLNKIKKALKNFVDFEERWLIVKSTGKIYKLEIKKNKSLYYQFIGLKKEEVEKIIKISSTRSLIPEPLRVAHMIASAMVKGESRGRA